MNRLVQNVFMEPWHIQPEAHAAVAGLVINRVMARSDRMAVDTSVPAVAGLQLSLDDFVQPKPETKMDQNGIAHVPLFGYMAKRVSPIEKSCGVCDTDEMRANIAMFKEQGAKGFMFFVNSPGGMALGTPELAADVAAIDVPTMSFTNEVQASAAYYALAGVDTIVSSGSANVGSIGTYMPWVDYSEYWEKMGVKWDPVISSGSDLKAAGAGPSLSEAHREYFQERIDELNNEFKGFVSAHRDVDDDTMRGQVFFGKTAASKGLVDFVGDYNDAYDTLLGEVRRSR